MTAPTIQPGTRCECRDGLHSHPLSHHKAPFICTRDAVRMVTNDRKMLARLRRYVR